MNKDWTAGETSAATEALETATATLLGRLVFGFARLDVALGLCLVWADGGKQIDALTPKVTALNFYKKLDSLAGLVDTKFAATRTLRNQLTHGRWGVNPYTDEAINVIGLPTSPDQHEVRFTLRALSDSVAETTRLQTQLSQLRERWPI